MTSPNIIDVYPAHGSQGMPVGDSVVVVFDQEIDLNSINEGSFVVSAPDNDVLFNGELQPFEPESFLQQLDVLSSPYYGGRVKGTIRFERRNASGGLIDDSTKDYDGDGALWNTAAIFTPEVPFRANVKYTVLVAGDTSPDSDFDSGIFTRSVFDTKLEVGTNESANFCGTFTGDASEQYFIRISSAGETGAAEYVWWKGSDPLTTFEGLTSTGKRELENGVCVFFDKDATHTSGDKWSVIVKPYELMDTNYSFQFYTGSGSIVVPPSERSTTGIESIASEEASPLMIVEITPVDGATNLDPESIVTIEVKFNKNLDPTTITPETVRVIATAVNGDPEISAAGEIATVLDVSGNVLTIQIQ